MPIIARWSTVKSVLTCRSTAISVGLRCSRTYHYRDPVRTTGIDNDQSKNSNPWQSFIACTCQFYIDLLVDVCNGLQYVIYSQHIVSVTQTRTLMTSPDKNCAPARARKSDLEQRLFSGCRRTPHQRCCLYHRKGAPDCRPVSPDNCYGSRQRHSCRHLQNWHCPRIACRPSAQTAWCADYPPADDQLTQMPGTVVYPEYGCH